MSVWGRGGGSERGPGYLVLQLWVSTLSFGMWLSWPCADSPHPFSLPNFTDDWANWPDLSFFKVFLVLVFSSVAVLPSGRVPGWMVSLDPAGALGIVRVGVDCRQLSLLSNEGITESHPIAAHRSFKLSFSTKSLHDSTYFSSCSKERLVPEGWKNLDIWGEFVARNFLKHKLLCF